MGGVGEVGEMAANLAVNNVFFFAISPINKCDNHKLILFLTFDGVPEGKMSKEKEKHIII